MQFGVDSLVFYEFYHLGKPLYPLIHCYLIAFFVDFDLCTASEEWKIQLKSNVIL